MDIGGPGKRFCLHAGRKTWRKKEFNAIYFNAWEDDFCDDPLVAIIGQLSNSFQDKDFKEIGEIIGNIMEKAKPLLIPTVLGILNKTTGIVIPEESLKNLRGSYLDEYVEQIKNKNDLKETLKGAG